MIKRILLLEDFGLIALSAAEALSQFDEAEIITAANVSQALRMIAEGPIDAAVIEVSIGRDTALPVARALYEAGIAFIIATGFDGKNAVEVTYPHVPRIAKPYDPQMLVDTLLSEFKRLRPDPVTA